MSVQLGSVHTGQANEGWGGEVARGALHQDWCA